MTPIDERIRAIRREDLVKRLRNGIIEHKKRWSGDTHADLGGSVDYEATENLMAEAAAHIIELEAALAEAQATRRPSGDTEQRTGQPHGPRKASGLAAGS